MATNKVAEIVVDRLVKKIKENKRLPWQVPYIAPCINWFSRTEYRGINRILLGGGEFITTNQLKKYNEQHETNFWFEKGTPSEIVVFYSKTEKKLDEDKIKEIERDGISSKDFGKIMKNKDGEWVRVSWILRYYTVYNIEYMTDRKTGEKLQPHMGNTIVETHSEAESVINKYIDASGVKMFEDSTGCPYYTELTDSVHTPKKNYFNSSEAYYRTVFHELIHSTGVTWRLNRECFAKYHSDKTKGERSREELIAEMGSLLLASECGFKDEHLDDNSDAYITSWCSWLKDNTNDVLNGMLASEKAKQYILDGGVATSTATDGEDLAETKIPDSKN